MLYRLAPFIFSNFIVFLLSFFKVFWEIKSHLHKVRSITVMSMVNDNSLFYFFSSSLNQIRRFYLFIIFITFAVQSMTFSIFPFYYETHNIDTNFSECEKKHKVQFNFHISTNFNFYKFEHFLWKFSFVWKMFSNFIRILWLNHRKFWIYFHTFRKIHSLLLPQKLV